jgi:amidase
VATGAGKLLTDELACGIHGDNLNYGTPVNPNAPGRVPGGSSIGSAACCRSKACCPCTRASTRRPGRMLGLG